MSKKNYAFVPQGDSGKDYWLKNFADKLPLYAVKYNLTAAEIADVQASSAFFAYCLNYKHQLDEYNKKVTKYKNEFRDGIQPGATPSVMPQPPAIGIIPPATAPGAFDRAVSVANRIKKHIEYTEADGSDLGIETSATGKVDLNTVKPSLRVGQINDADIEIVWIKKSMDRLEIHVDRGDGSGFLAYDTYPNFTDVNTLKKGETAVWTYKAIYIKNDNRVGQWSDEVRITVTGKE